MSKEYNNKQTSRSTRRNGKGRAQNAKSTNGKPNCKDKACRDTINDVSCTGNDPSWYSKYPQLVQDTASIGFFNPVGQVFSFKVDDKIAPYTLQSNDTFIAPGICTLEYVPSMGYSDDFGSQINIVARNVYSFIRHANSGHSNYEPADLMMYLGAMDSAYAYYAWMVRVYGIARLYSPVNKYYPLGLFDAMHLDFPSIQKHLADLRAYINLYGAKLGALVVPSSTTMAIRHQWMNSNLFTDSLTAKAQTYMFNPIGFYTYDDHSDPNGTSLQFTYTGYSSASLGTFDTIVAFGDSIINGIVSSEDAGIISGDILKAFGTNGILKFSEMPSDYSVVPVFNPEVLTQIQNATIVGQPDKPTMAVTQNVTKQSIIFTPKSRFTDNVSTDKRRTEWAARRTFDKIITMPVDVPTPDQVMVATRLVTIPSVDIEGTKGWLVYDCVGTEIITGVWITTRDPYADDKHIVTWTVNSMLWKTNPDSGGVIGFPGYAKMISALSMFAAHPEVDIEMSTLDEHGNLSTMYVPMYNVDNYQLFTKNDVKKMHEVALLSELSYDNVTTSVKR